MITEREIVDAITKYESHVKMGNNMLMDYYGLDLSPFLAKNKGIIPKQGTILHKQRTLRFSFHGIGAYFDFDGIIVDFDYAFGSFQYNGFQLSKLLLFINTSAPPDKGKLDQADLLPLIQKLLISGTLVAKPVDSINTYEYSLNSE
ncbi:MAG: hypothetical protein AAGN35_27780 [Bacteroidota bacterium]